MSRTVQRITLNLTSRPAVALENLQARNDESQTQAVSRALMLRDWIEEMVASGQTDLVLHDRATGESTRVVIL